MEDLKIQEPPTSENPYLSHKLISLVVGITNPCTMKLVRHLGGTEVVVMIDPGATHNFISTSTINTLKILLTSTIKFGVSFGTGVAVQDIGMSVGGPPPPRHDGD